MQSIGVGIVFSIVLALFLGIIPVLFLGSLWWFVVVLFLVLSSLLFGRFQNVPIEHRGAYTFLDKRVVVERVENLPNGEKITIKEGAEAEEGIQWIPPFFSILVESVKQTPIPKKEEEDLSWKVYAKDGIELSTHVSILYKVINVHQFQSIGRAEVEKSLIDLTEKSVRTGIRSKPSKYWLFSNEPKNSLASKILEEAKPIEKQWGVDVITVFVGDFDTDPEITKALKLKKQNKLYAEARNELKKNGIPDDEIKEVSQLNLGIAKPKNISETKYDVGATLSKAVENIGQGIGEGLGRSIGEIVGKNIADKVDKKPNP